jgi:hypothetical protein
MSMIKALPPARAARMRRPGVMHAQILTEPEQVRKQRFGRGSAAGNRSIMTGTSSSTLRKPVLYLN